MSDIEKRDSASVEADNEKGAVAEVGTHEALDQQSYGDVDEVYREKCQLSVFPRTQSFVVQV